jgi:hypothetical protein
MYLGLYGSINKMQGQFVALDTRYYCKNNCWVPDPVWPYFCNWCPGKRVNDLHQRNNSNYGFWPHHFAMTNHMTFKHCRICRILLEETINEFD